MRRLPCAGLTWVGVHPDHRRRGVLTAMLRHHFETVRDEPGWHLSALHASEPAIYGRHGYGLASLEHSFVLGRGAKLTAPHLDAAAGAVRTTFGTASDPGIAARVRRCWERSAEEEVGIITGEDDFYEAVCASSEEDRRGKEPVRVLFAHVDGEDVGLAGFRREQKWEHGRPGGDLTVFALVGGPAARLALLRRLVDFDLIGTVKVWSVGVADPMLTWLGSPRGASEVAVYDNLWVRLVDLPEGPGGARVRRRLRRGARRLGHVGALERRALAAAGRRQRGRPGGADRGRRRPAAARAGPRGALPRRRLPGGAGPLRRGRTGPARRGPRALARGAHRGATGGGHRLLSPATVAACPA